MHYFSTGADRGAGAGADPVTNQRDASIIYRWIR